MLYLLPCGEYSLPLLRQATVHRSRDPPSTKFHAVKTVSSTPFIALFEDVRNGVGSTRDEAAFQVSLLNDRGMKIARLASICMIARSSNALSWLGQEGGKGIHGFVMGIVL